MEANARLEYELVADVHHWERVQESGSTQGRDAKEPLRVAVREAAARARLTIGHTTRTLCPNRHESPGNHGNPRGAEHERTMPIAFTDAGLSQSARVGALARQAGGHWFEPSTAHRNSLQIARMSCACGRQTRSRGED